MLRMLPCYRYIANGTNTPTPATVPCFGTCVFPTGPTSSSSTADTHTSRRRTLVPYVQCLCAVLACRNVGSANSWFCLDNLVISSGGGGGGGGSQQSTKKRLL